MSESARRIEAALGYGLPHLWRHGDLWVCMLGPPWVVQRRDPCAAVSELRTAVSEMRVLLARAQAHADALRAYP